MDAPTPRNLSKWAVSAAISWKTGKAVENTISDHTRFDSDDLIVELASGSIGWIVAYRAKPYTDKMVDKTADWISERRNKRNQDNTDKE
jgi:hypothetical protein